MPENPFSPHSPATVARFVDREREVDLIFDHIRSAQRGNVAVSGALGDGKTSLLRFIADPAVGEAYGVRPPQNLLVYVDTQSVTPFSADRFWRRVAQLAARDTAVDLGAPNERLLARPELDVNDLEEYLDTLADRGIGLVLLLDEFEWALQAASPEAEAESRHFLAQMASLARRAPRALGLVVATEAPLPEATRVIESWRGSPFATVFTSLVLRPLDRGGSDRLVDKALEGSGLRFDEDERSRLYAIAGGRPAALQAAAFSLFHGRQRELTSEALWTAVKAAAGDALALPRQAAARLEPANAPARALAEVGVPAAGLPVAQRSNNGATKLDPGQGLWLDASTGEVSVGGRRVASLTALEYSLLRLLYASPGQLCSKQDIIRQVWGEEFMGEVDDSRVEKLVSRLRRKIEPMPGRPQHIRTVRGRGYRYVP